MTMHARRAEDRGRAQDTPNAMDPSLDAPTLHHAGRPPRGREDAQDDARTTARHGRQVAA